MCTSNCLECSDADTCIKCLPTYGLDSNNYCAACHATNCKNCSSNVEKCDTCVNGYFLDDFDGTCIRCNDYVTNCRICATVNTCL